MKNLIIFLTLLTSPLLSAEWKAGGYLMATNGFSVGDGYIQGVGAYSGTTVLTSLTSNLRNLYDFDLGAFIQRDWLGLELGARYGLSHDVPLTYSYSYDFGLLEQGQGQMHYYVQHQMTSFYLGTYALVPYTTKTYASLRGGVVLSSGTLSVRNDDDTTSHYDQNNYSFTAVNPFAELALRQEFNINAYSRISLETGYTYNVVGNLQFVQTKHETDTHFSTFGPTPSMAGSAMTLDASRVFIRLRLEFGFHWLDAPKLNP